MVPNDRRYTKEHEWVQVAGSVATIGITDFAQTELGDIVYVELPEVGRTVEAGEALGTIESVKAVSEIYAPVSGSVAEVNAALRDHPESINSDAHGQGWICRITLASPNQVGSLMDADAYRALIGGSLST